MNKILLILAVELFSSALFSQTIIDVTESTFRLNKSNREKILYYGFAEGDQLIFNFKGKGGRRLQQIEISELSSSSSSSKFLGYKLSHVDNKIININRTGIYTFRFLNTGSFARTCEVKIQRIPATAALNNFNSSVYWHNVTDTVFVPSEEIYLAGSDTIAREIYASTVQISSKNAINKNKNFQIVEFTLPENTLSWSFYIGTGTKGKAEYDIARSNFNRNATIAVSQIPGYGAMAALALTGISYFSNVQGEDNVKYWFLNDVNSVTQFSASQEFSNFKHGDLVNEASQMKFPLTGKIYLALLNDNTIEPIKVTINITAIQLTPKWSKRPTQAAKLINRQGAYLKN